MKNCEERTIKSFLDISFEKFAERNFLGFSDENAKTYSDVKSEMMSVVSLLENLGVKQYDKVAIFSNNMPNWGITYFALSYMGAIAIPILPDFSREEIKNILIHSETQVLFVSEILEYKMEGIETDFLKDRIRINDFTNLLDSTNSLQIKDALPKNEYCVVEDDLAVIIYTSGTTGRSKGVMLTNKNITFAVEMSLVRQPMYKSDRFLSFLPLSHTFENSLGLVLPMRVGASIFYLRRLPTPAILMPAMLKVKPTVMLTVPIIMEKIYRNKVVPGINSKASTRLMYKIPPFRKLLNRLAGKKLLESFGGELKCFGIGGAKVDPTVEKFMIEAKIPYGIGYGITETAPIVAGLSPWMIRHESCGPAFDGVEIKLHNLNPDTGEGEVWVRGDNVMKGYYKDPELTKEVITEDKWFKTGDLACYGKDKFLYIKGRIKNVIVGSSGENIYPEEIESVINNFNFVTESLVIEEKGRLVALVHLNMDEIEKKYQNVMHELDEKIEEYKNDLKLYINANVNKFSAIKIVAIHDKPLEKTPTQKIKRYKYKNFAL